MMQSSKKGFCILLMLAFGLTACTSPKPPCKPTALDEMRSDLRKNAATDSVLARKNIALPRVVSQGLLPPFSTQFRTFGQRAQRHFDISANKMPAKAFFMGLVEGTPANMIVNPKVTGEISLNLKNVTVDEAMEMVRDVYGYAYRKTAYGYEVLPQELVTQMFTVNYLNVKRLGKSYTGISSGQISEKVAGTSMNGTTSTPVLTAPDKSSGSSVDTRSRMDFWHDLGIMLKSLIGTANGRSVVVDPQAGLVIVRAFPNELQEVARYLDSTQSNLNRQVVLEAKILEVQLNDEFQAGIDWNLFGRIALGNGGIGQESAQSLTGLDFNLNDFSSIFTLRVYGKFGTLIKLLQMQGNVQVLSSPRISTVNNQKAVIKVGSDSFYVTGVSTSNTIVGNNTLPSEDVNLTPFFSGITLDVTPQISHEKEVILHIHPTISRVTEQQKNIILGTTPSSTPGVAASNNTFTLPLAQSTIRESDNMVRAKSGQIVVIGGLMQNNMIEQVAAVPFLSRIPLIGPFFRRTQQISEKSELVILLRPIIVENRTWVNELSEADRKFSKLDRGFHAGSLPETFGTEAEREDFRCRGRDCSQYEAWTEKYKGASD